MEDKLILVNEQDEEVGTEVKLEVHEKGALHRAFSILVFDSSKKLIIQKRAEGKYHSGGLWANTCCSHPREGEKLDVAIHRRLKEEMGFDCQLEEKFSFIYEVKLNDLKEHEFDHVFFGNYDGEIEPNPKEVSEIKRVSWSELSQDVEKNPDQYAYWFKIIVREINQRKFI
ncbi:MAG: isopentenyl-diphosphate Delta-isomerase [Patescibacteria group bacterium]